MNKILWLGRYLYENKLNLALLAILVVLAVQFHGVNKTLKDTLPTIAESTEGFSKSFDEKACDPDCADITVKDLIQLQNKIH